MNNNTCVMITFSPDNVEGGKKLPFPFMPFDISINGSLPQEHSYNLKCLALFFKLILQK